MVKKSLITLTLLLIILNSFITATSSEININTSDMDMTKRSYWPTDEWIKSSPEEQGMDSKILSLSSTFISDNNLAIDSLLVIRHGYLVYEEYPRSYIYSEYTKHLLYSVTKSFSSALIGIALNQSIISSVDDKLLSFFPNYVLNNLDERKARRLKPGDKLRIR